MRPRREMNASERGALEQVYPVLLTLPVPLRRQIDECGEPLRLSAGHRVFDDGDTCSHCPLLVEGSLRVSKRGPAGDEILLYHVNPGETCALTVVALLGGAPYSATGTVETGALLYAIPRVVFLDLVLGSSPFRVFVFSALSRRMSDLMALVDDMAFRGIAQRLAARLLQHPQPLEATHQMLADELNTRREVVSRILGTFQQSGLIRLGRKRIEILDRRALDGLLLVEGR